MSGGRKPEGHDEGTHPTPLLDRLAKSSRATSRQRALIEGNSDPVGYWLTPPDLMKELDEEFGFTFDACPYPRAEGFDGLKESWGEVTWVNPPFVGPASSRTAWARKAIAESRKGKTVVMINSVDRWLTELVKAGAEFRVPREFKWLDPKGRPQRAARPSMMWILRGRKVA